MKQHIHIKNITDIATNNPIRLYHNNMIGIAEVDSNKNILHLQPAAYINANTTLFVTKGSIIVNINYKKYEVKAGNALLLSPAHLVAAESFSNNFKASILFVGRDYMDEMDPIDIISVRTRYGVKLYSQPVIKLSAEENSLMAERLSKLKDIVDNIEHYYYKEMVLSSLIILFLDLSNIIEKNSESISEPLPRREYVTSMFMQLLIKNYRTQHSVTFYSSALNITPHYLTLVVKQVTGQSVCDFINEMLFSRARALLEQNKMSIQEIATYLHFSDQSAFGKFFKRLSGVSPKEFRKR